MDPRGEGGLVSFVASPEGGLDGSWILEGVVSAFLVLEEFVVCAEEKLDRFFLDAFFESSQGLSLSLIESGDRATLLFSSALMLLVDGKVSSSVDFSCTLSVSSEDFPADSEALALSASVAVISTPPEDFPGSIKESCSGSIVDFSVVIANFPVVPAAAASPSLFSSDWASSAECSEEFPPDFILESVSATLSAEPTAPDSFAEDFRVTVDGFLSGSSPLSTSCAPGLLPSISLETSTSVSRLDPFLALAAAVSAVGGTLGSSLVTAAGLKTPKFFFSPSGLVPPFACPSSGGTLDLEEATEELSSSSSSSGGGATLTTGECNLNIAG
mmetsp:Transcript_1364/g.2879  ORF Transcript_1364/g.2879 Transcript_1364/m.2879 type:complete len:328 (-) Transcript_1364:170-1153(-)